MVQAACSELGAGPIGASVGNELVGRRCRVVHGDDPHAPPGVRIIRFRTSRNVTRRGRPPQRGGLLAQPVSRVWRAGAGGDRVATTRRARRPGGAEHRDDPRRLAALTPRSGVTPGDWAGSHPLRPSDTFIAGAAAPTDDLREWRDPRRTQVFLSLAKRGALERDLARRSCLATNSGPVRAATRLMRWTRRERTCTSSACF